MHLIFRKKNRQRRLVCYDRPFRSISLKPRTATAVLPTTRLLRTTRPTRPVPIMFRRLRRCALFGVSRLARFLIRRAHLEGITILQFLLSVQISGHSHIPSASIKIIPKKRRQNILVSASAPYSPHPRPLAAPRDSSCPDRRPDPAPRLRCRCRTSSTRCCAG
jgi:hypothetical protein